MESIHQQILDKLSALEAERGIHIPLAVESGSRAWGFASPDSDFDCRFVYVRPREAYLSVFEEKDTIEYAPDAVFDVSGWDVRKALAHLVKSNAVMLEWLRSGVIYRKDDAVARELWRAGEMYFNPIAVSWHYLSMARKKLAEISAGDSAKLKRYFYILRPLACVRFIRERQSIPFMEYRRNLEAISIPDEVLEEIEGLLALKERAEEGRMVPRNERLIAYFEREAADAEAWLSRQHKAPGEDAEQANVCFRNILEIVYQHV